MASDTLEFLLFTGFVDVETAQQYRDRLNAVLDASPLSEWLGRAVIRPYIQEYPHLGDALWYVGSDKSAAKSPEQLKDSLIYELCQAIGWGKLALSAPAKARDHE